MSTFVILTFELLNTPSFNFAQRAWSYVNDSFRLTLCLRFRPEAIACACIYMTSVSLGIELPMTPAPWYEIFDATAEELDEIAFKIHELYQHPAPKYIDLNAADRAKQKERDLEKRKEEESRRSHERRRGSRVLVFL